MDYSSLKNTLDYALFYRELELSVIPFGGSGENLKKPFSSWRQFQTRLPTKEEIEQWFPLRTTKNLGIVTGVISSAFALDVDTEEGYRFVMGKGIPGTVTARTGSDTWHFFFQYPGWKVVTLNDKKHHWGCPGCDVRGDGGCIVLPPSIHPCGGRYRWERAPGEFPFAPAPDWLLELLQNRNGDNGKVNRNAEVFLAQALKGCIIGERDDRAFDLACQLRDAGYGYQEAKPFLIRYADQVPQSTERPFTRNQSLVKICSAYKKPPRPPIVSRKTEKDMPFFIRWHNASSNVRDPRFDGIQRAVCNELASLTDWNGSKIRCSIVKLAERLGYSESPIKKARQRARELGIIKWENLAGEKRGRFFSEYELQVETLKALSSIKNNETK